MTTTRKFILALLILFTSQDCPVRAQQSLPTDNFENVKQSIDLLEQEIKRSKAETAVDDTVNKNAGIKSAPELPNLSLDWGGVEAPQPDLPAAPQKNDEFDPSDIFYRIDLLNRIKRDKSMTDQMKTQAANQIMGTAQPEPNPKLIVEARPIPQPTKMESQIGAPNLNPMPEPMNMANKPAENPLSNPLTNQNADRILPEPVDTFEMANSLFQTGRISTALDAYEAVDVNSLTAFDAAWLRFMIANCKRRLGEVTKATRVYRDLSEEKDSANLVQASQWWLKHNEEMTNTNINFEQLQRDIEAVRERINRYDNQ